jgi:hypothetical protein
MADEKQTFTHTAADWLKGQPFNNVLLLGLLSVVVYGGYLALTDAIPAHLKQIQDGYKSLADQNAASMTEKDKQHHEQVTELRMTFEKTLDRYERVWSEKADGRRTTLITPKE